MATRPSRSTDLATKADLQAVNADLRAHVRGVESKLSADIQAVSAEIRANGVVLERVESKLTAMSEGFQSVAAKSEVKADLDRLSGRVSLLEEVAREHSEDIRLLRVPR
jgi:hypothetical protein